MKKIIHSTLLLPLIVASAMISATLSPNQDKTKTKKKKETPTTIILLRDTTNCANYYEAKAVIKPSKHKATCPDDCMEFHTETVILEKTLKQCPKGKLYNPRKLACDFPENVVTCTHTPKCTNN